MRLIRILAGLAFFTFLAVPLSLSAQTPKDSTHVRSQAATLKVAKERADSVNRALAQCAATKSCSGYLKTAGLVQQRLLSMFPGFFAAESALVANVPVPPQPPQPPAPSDSGPALPALLTRTSVADTPSPGRTLRVTGSLQAALDSARSGDKLLLHVGQTYVGNFVIPAKGCAGGWLTVTSDSALPPEGTRVSPTARLPKLLPAFVNAVLTVAPQASCIRLMGLEVTVSDTTKLSNSLVDVGDGSATSNSQLPRKIVLDRMYIHGTDSVDVHRCVALNADSTAIVDSYIANCHARGKDAQAVWGWNANGPFKVVNNYLEASTEVFGFGGADPGIPGLVPSDIEFRRNYLSKPMAWKGGPWLVKNLIEFKNAQRALIDANVMENSFTQAQQGWAFVLWSVNQQGGCTWCVTRDVTITNNLVRNVSAGFQLNSTYGGAPNMSHLTIRNNVMVGVDNPLVSGGGYGVLTQGQVDDLTIEHNTFFVPTISAFQWGTGGQGALVNHVVRNNLTGGATYSLFASPANAWTAFVDTTTSRFAGNVVARGADYAAGYPTGNWYPATLDAIGLVGGASAAFALTDPLNLALTLASPFKGKGTDGKDPGADIAAILAATKGVVQP